MSATKIALLGAIAGFTIFLGLPVGRLRNPAPRLRALLNAGAVGILVFLLWDVLAHAWEPGSSAWSISTAGWAGAAVPPRRSRSRRPSRSRCRPAGSPTAPPRPWP